MPTEQRFDVTPIRATLTEDGYLLDPAAVITRTGVFEYRRADGSVRREYRPPEEVFAREHLDSWRGKPITAGHPGRVEARNVRRHAIGAVLSPARQDGENLVAEVIVHEPTVVTDQGLRELSCGYVADIDDTPGTANGQPYDCIQRKLRANHLAIVARGRAGNARLNLDAADVHSETERDMPAENPPTRTMSRVRLDGGLEYQAEPEVVREVEKLRGDVVAANKRADAAEAERDTLQTKAKEHEAELKKAREDAAKEAGEAVRARAGLEATAKQHGVEVKDDHTPRQIREAVLRKLRGDALKLDGKSDDYVESAYDLAVADAGAAKGGGAARGDSAAPRKTEFPASGSLRGDERPRSLPASDARRRMLAGMARDPMQTSARSN